MLGYNDMRMSVVGWTVDAETESMVSLNVNSGDGDFTLCRESNAKNHDSSQHNQIKSKSIA